MKKARDDARARASGTGSREDASASASEDRATSRSSNDDERTNDGALKGERSGESEREERKGGVEPKKFARASARRAARACRAAVAAGVFMFGVLWTYARSNALSRVVVFAFVSSSVALGLRSGAGKKAKAPAPPTTMYSAFLKELKHGRVASVRFEEGSTRLLYDVRVEATAEAKGGKGRGAATATATTGSEARAVKTFQTKRVMGDSDLMKKLEAAEGVEFGAVAPAVSRLASKGMFTVLAMWIPIIPLLIFMRNAINRQSSGGKKRKKPASKDDMNRVTFKDVAGVDDAKAELYELVQIMKNAEQYKNVRGRLPTGCLLVGPPGTGKTLLARAVAGESNVAFFPVAASEFVELFVGRGAARVRELFAEARKSRPAIIFIDELDAVGSRRGAGLNEERDQTLNQLLVEMDGFAKDSGVLILAATNRPDALDPALLRPGRLTRRVFVGPPGQQGRAQILFVHLRGIDLEENINVVCDVISRATPGFTGAELANVCNEAALLSVRDNRQIVTINDLLSGVSRTKDGIATSSNRADAMFRDLRNRFLGNYKDVGPPPPLADEKKFSGNGAPISMGPS